MYEEFFGLSRRPFGSVPQVDFYYPGEAIEAARQTLVRCIERAEGVGMAVGPSGTGKTLLCMMLAEQFRESFQVALLASGRLSTRRALLQAILFELGRPYRGMDEGELRLALVDHLTTSGDCPRGMLLLVDEAHTLPLRLLDEIRMITNLVSSGQPRTRLVLAGGPLLEERFASPKLESFSQRVAARCYLESLNREETQAYVHAQFATAGCEGQEVISDDACHAVYQATDGVPRLINQVCDHALLLARAAGREQIDRAVVEEAWADLQQLPTPWNEGCGDERFQGGIIEFGGLDEESDKSEQTASDAAESLPMLRISPESEEAAAGPVEELERIEKALSDLSDDFQPAGSIGPELELVFDKLRDPFGEEFEEEELILDHGEPEGAADVDERPKPSRQPDSEESGGAETPQERPASVDEEGDLPESRRAAEGREEPAISDEAVEAAIGDEATHAPTPETDDQEVAGPWEAEPETVPMCPRQPDEKAEEDDALEPEEEDVIIIEEGYDDSDLVHARPATTVRRQEYRQLFARLRRGS